MGSEDVSARALTNVKKGHGEEKDGKKKNEK
jgi:hypothetical protein